MSRNITADMVESIKYASEVLEWWNSYGALYKDLVSKLEALGYEVTLSHTGVDVKGSGDRKMLVGAFRALRTAGFNTGRRPGAKDSYYSAFFDHPELRRIWFAFSSTVCQRVQVGTEVKEVPVYETQCVDSMEVTDEDMEVNADVAQ